MPCFCDPDDKEVNITKIKIRTYSYEIVNLIKKISHPTDRYPQLLKDSMKLLEHLYTGNCDER